MKKKIIIFNPSLEDGGVEKNLFLVSNYLSSKDYSIEILTCNNEKINKFSKGIKFIGTKNTFWQKKSRKVKYLICLQILFFNLLFRNDKPLIFAFQANIYAVIVAKILNTKIITRSNSAPSGWSKNFIKNKLYKITIKLANDVMVNSLDFKKSFKKRFNIDAECIYNPFNKEFIKNNLKKKKIKIDFFKKGYLNVISIGRLTNQKDHLTILKAIENLKSDFRIRLIIMGKGTNKFLLQEYINNKNLKNKVKLIGYKKNPYPYIQRSDIVLLSSKYEGLPNILLEGQFLKKYIISTNCPTGPKEILLNGKAGDLVKISDYKRIAELISSYYKNKKRINKMIKTGTDNFYRFDYSVNCLKYLNFVSRNF
jgi:glycosyltransferase involved in cell wall biosynthesis